MTMRFDSSEQLVAYLQHDELPGLDSEFSGTSKALVEQFSAKGMDANRWWIYTPTEWRCPSCERSKPEIVRLNKHGFLTAHLHEHHDHMCDYVRQEFTRLSEGRKIVVADAVAEQFVQRTAKALSAYDNTVICSDCNAADAKAKAVVQAPNEFSFSPGEIKQFIDVSPNREHSINRFAASEVWSACKPVFETRWKLVKYIAELGANNEHWFQASNINAKKVYDRAQFLMTYYGLKELNPIDTDSLLYQSNKFAGRSNSWRKKSKPEKVSAPSSSELQHLINVKGTYWVKVPDDWFCPVCDRNKVACVRRSNAGEWTFILSTSKALFSKHPPSYVQHLGICNDCSTTATRIGAEIEEAVGVKLEHSSSVITPYELACVISPQPHQKHMILGEALEEMIPSLSLRVDLGQVR